MASRTSSRSSHRPSSDASTSRSTSLPAQTLALLQALRTKAAAYRSFAQLVFSANEQAVVKAWDVLVAAHNAGSEAWVAFYSHFEAACRSPEGRKDMRQGTITGVSRVRAAVSRHVPAEQDDAWPARRAALMQAVDEVLAAIKADPICLITPDECYEAYEEWRLDIARGIHPDVREEDGAALTSANSGLTAEGATSSPVAQSALHTAIPQSDNPLEHSTASQAGTEGVSSAVSITEDAVVDDAG